MSFPFGNIVEDLNVPPNQVWLVNVKYRPIMLAPGQSISDLSFEEKLERGIDWDATAKASAVIRNIGDKNE